MGHIGLFRASYVFSSDGSDGAAIIESRQHDHNENVVISSFLDAPSLARKMMFHAEMIWVATEENINSVNKTITPGLLRQISFSNTT